MSSQRRKAERLIATGQRIDTQPRWRLLKPLTPIATTTFARQNQVNDKGQQCKNHQIKKLGFIYHNDLHHSDVELAAQIIGQLWVVTSACREFGFPRDLSRLLDTSRVAALKTIRVNS